MNPNHERAEAEADYADWGRLGQLSHEMQALLVAFTHADEPEDTLERKMTKRRRKVREIIARLELDR